MKRRLSAEAAAYGLFLVLGVCSSGRCCCAVRCCCRSTTWASSIPGRRRRPAPQPRSGRFPGTPCWPTACCKHLPWRQLARESLRGGFSLNPHQFCGTPFIANYQSAVFYPPNLLFWILPAARAWLRAGASLLVSAFAYLLPAGRGLEVRRLRGGSAFELCGFVVAWLELPTAVNVMVRLPLALHLYDRGRTRNGWRRLAHLFR